MSCVITSLESANKNALSNVQRYIDGLLTVRHPWAPAMSISMGRIAGQSCASCHVDSKLSLEGCLGEAAEIISQAREIPEILRPMNEDAPRASGIWQKENEQGIGIVAEDLKSGEQVLVPECLVFPGMAEKPKTVLSSGCAAGKDIEHATASALNEVIEHELSNRWWYGLSQPTLTDGVDNSESGPTSLSQELQGYISDKRSGAAIRRDTEIYCLGTLAGIHVVVAFSFDGALDKGFSIAAAADKDMLSAAKNAFRELCQMEFGLYTARQLEERPILEKKPDDFHLSRAGCISRSDSRLEFLRSSAQKRRFIHSSKEFNTPLDMLINKNIKIYRIVLHQENGLAVVKLIIPIWTCRRTPFV